MYMPAISILILGVSLLILNIVIFFDDYKVTIINPEKKKLLYANGVIISSSIGLIVLSIIYFLTINKQLN